MGYKEMVTPQDRDKITMSTKNPQSKPHTKSTRSKRRAKTDEELAQIVSESGLQLWEVSCTTIITVLAKTPEEAKSIADESMEYVLESPPDFIFSAKPLPSPHPSHREEMIESLSKQFAYSAPPPEGKLLHEFEWDDTSDGSAGVPSIGQWIKAGAAKEWLPKAPAK